VVFIFVEISFPSNAFAVDSTSFNAVFSTSTPPTSSFGVITSSETTSEDGVSTISSVACGCCVGDCLDNNSFFNPSTYLSTINAGGTPCG